MADLPEAEGGPELPPPPVEVVSDDGRSAGGSWEYDQVQEMFRQEAGGLYPEGYPSPPPYALANMAQYYEAQMRDHAAAYASAAAGAAWAAAQIATNGYGPPPPMLPPLPSAMVGPSYPHYVAGMPPRPRQGPPMWEHTREEQLNHPGEMASQESFEQGDPPVHPRDNGLHEHPPAESQARKRQQRTTAVDTTQGSSRPHGPRKSGSSKQDSSKRGRRRLRSALGDSSDASNHALPPRQKHLRHHSGSSGGYNSARNSSKRDSELSLLGKTAVSALYEWCDKQRWSSPIFVQQPSATKSPAEFEVSVYINEEERGLGRGASKVSAKKDAAQKAFLTMLPGAVFDDNGMLVEVPQDDIRDDLAPNLASRLAIGSSKKKKRHWNVYPGTSTTSEEDGDNGYYASRGASVCSALLHTMWQIDDRIPEPPCYTYDLVPNPANGNAQLKRKGPTTGEVAMTIHRSSFRCTARLVIRNTTRENIADCGPVPHLNHEGEAEDKALEIEENQNRCQPSESENSLTAIGTGATKREARHKASSKLLAMLFPECDGMVEVKTAAEAVREKHAAARALKHSSRKPVPHKRQKQDHEDDGAPIRKRSIDLFLPDPSDPPMPSCLYQQLQRCIGGGTNDLDLDSVSVESLSLSDKVAPTTSVSPMKESDDAGRSLERQRQLNYQVDGALHEMNELVDNGRTPDEYIDDGDVGRTVLRRAEQDDRSWVQRLLNKNSPDTCKKTKTIGPVSVLLGTEAPPLDCQTNSVRFWRSMAVTLLLCRAIAPFEDPPLGCATLTLGFSIEKGRVLRVASIVSEPHLPKERFVECLTRFAVHMKCELLHSDGEPQSVSRDGSGSGERPIDVDVARSVVAAYTTCQPADKMPEILDLKTIGKSLQSVEEEDTEAEETDIAKSKARDMPNKRSRVA